MKEGESNEEAVSRLEAEVAEAGTDLRRLQAELAEMEGDENYIHNTVKRSKLFWLRIVGLLRRD